MQNEIYYHFHKRGIYDAEWFVGNELEFVENDFIKKSLNFRPCMDAYDQKDVPYCNVVEYSSNISDYGILPLLVDMSSNFITEYSILLREVALESIREKYYGNLPSRYNCIWLCKEEQLEFWKNTLEGECDLYKVEIYSKPFKSCNSLLPLPSDSYNEMLEKSKMYWSFTNEKHAENDIEYLYSGKFKIIEKIEMYNDNLK